MGRNFLKIPKFPEFNLVIDQEQMWNFGAEDLEEAIMGIAYQRKKKTENNDEDEKNENLDESLRKLILGKFDDKKSEFYEWSKTILDEVLLAMENYFFILII